jgi:hypothetical protein
MQAVAWNHRLNPLLWSERIPMTQPGLLRFFGGLFRPPAPHRKYSFDPVHPSLFDSRRTSTPCDEESRRRIGAVLCGPPIAPSVCKRSEEVSFSAAEIAALAVDVDNQTQLSVTGVDSDNYAVRFCAQAGGPSEDDARRSLEKITFTRSGQTLNVRKPRYSRERPAGAWLHIDAARHRAISLKGSYSYMELFGIDAPVQVSTTHARLKMIEISDTVRATARVGIIDFAGDRGRIQLEADGEIGEINLKFAAPLFDGTVHAEAEVNPCLAPSEKRIAV